MIMILKDLYYSCVDLLLPAICPICEIRGLEYPSVICPECSNRLMASKIPLVTSSNYISEILSLAYYSGVVKKCVTQFKYYGKQQLVHVFEKMIQGMFVKTFFKNKVFDFVVPVPIHRSRYRKRGFNQSEIIAQILSRILDVPLSLRHLIKTKNTAPQIELSKKTRSHNLKNSFSVFNSSVFFRKKILLIDDVMTTGTTLDACAKELIRTGAASISAFTLAKTSPLQGAEDSTSAFAVNEIHT